MHHILIIIFFVIIVNTPTRTSLCNYNVPYRNFNYGDFQITMVAILDKTVYMYINASCRI